MPKPKRSTAPLFRLFIVLWACLLLFAWPKSALAATNIAGGRIIDQTWTLAGSPYMVQGDILVPAGAKLTIEAGVTVLFATSDGLGAGADTARVEATVRGMLEVNGTAANPVSFQSMGVAGQWYGLVLDTPTSIITTTNLVLQHAKIAITVSAGAPVLTDFTAHTNEGGVYFLGAGGGALANAVIRNNTQHAVVVNSNAGAAVSVSLANMTINQNNQGGVWVGTTTGSSATVSVANSIITNNSCGVCGLYEPANVSVSVTHSNVWNNSTNLPSDLAMGIGVLSSNPLYVAAPNNLRLTSNSPCRFASDTGGDIGTLPYTGDATNGLLGTLWTDTTLSLSGSPYRALGDLTVPPGVTLTIDPGVTLEFSATDQMKSGSDASRSELRMSGTLRSNGTAAQPVTMRSSSSRWWGPQFFATSSNNSVKNTVIMTAMYGVYVAQGSQSLDGLTLHHNEYGAYFVGAGSGSITNSVIRNNDIDGVQLIAGRGERVSLSLTNVTIYGNGQDGVEVSGDSGSASLTVTNSIISHQRASRGIRRSSGSGTTTVTYSNVWNNSVNYQNVVPGEGTISVNPLYVGAPENLRLQDLSLCIDAGTMTGAPDRDIEGTRPRGSSRRRGRGARASAGSRRSATAVLARRANVKHRRARTPRPSDKRVETA